jgi:hypothetical protein
VFTQETFMTNKIGNKHEAQHRGKQERLEIRRTNLAREAVKMAEARAKYHNQVKGRSQTDLSA